MNVVHRKETFRAEEALTKDLLSKNNVKVYWNTETEEILGDKEVEGEKIVKSVALVDNKTGEKQELAVDGVFVQIGESPNSQLAKASGVETDEGGAVKIDINQRTNIPGVFAAGDVTNHPVRQIGTAVGQGITAALEAYSYIRQPYYRK